MANRVEIANIGTVNCTFTPAASSHTALDAIGAAATVTIAGGTGKFISIKGNRLSIATTTPTTSVYKAFLFKSTPTVIADDAPMVVATADGPKLLGVVDIIQPVDFISTWQEAQSSHAAPGILIGPLETETITVYLMNISTITTEAVPFKLTLFYDILN